jgi:hypothetical protein
VFVADRAMTFPRRRIVRRTTPASATPMDKCPQFTTTCAFANELNRCDRHTL